MHYFGLKKFQYQRDTYQNLEVLQALYLQGHFDLLFHYEQKTLYILHSLHHSCGQGALKYTKQLFYSNHMG
nr:MAG TPA: hypothetical protein [Caudoviricetes sp.]